MNLKESNKCTYGNEQTAKYFWESCAKNELKHLRNTEPDLKRYYKTKTCRILASFKEMEKRLRNEENQFKNSNARKSPQDK